MSEQQSQHTSVRLYVRSPSVLRTYIAVGVKHSGTPEFVTSLLYGLQTFRENTKCYLNREEWDGLKTESVRSAKMSVSLYETARRRPLRTGSERNILRFREKQNCQPHFCHIRFYTFKLLCNFTYVPQHSAAFSCDYFHENWNVERNFVKISLSRLQINLGNNLKNAFRNPITGLGGVK
jgi:hypothetical protein